MDLSIIIMKLMLHQVSAAYVVDNICVIYGVVFIIEYYIHSNSENV